MTGMNIVDTSHSYRQYGPLLTRTAHLIVPRDGAPGRISILKAEVSFADLHKTCSAKVSVLSDAFTWTVLVEEPIPGVFPAGPSYVIDQTMDDLADELLSRAATILGC